MPSMRDLGDNTSPTALDYSRPGRTARRPGRRLLTYLFVALVAATVVPALPFALFVVGDWHAVSTDRSYFETKASDATVLGKTPAQVLALLGTPAGDMDDHAGYRGLTYQHGLAYCRVEFQNGTAIRTVRWIK